MASVSNLKFRPYARLLTMLGEQLIKNERVALVELIKNSYDADADWVIIKFENFGENMERLNDSKIIIEDDGEGMSSSVIKNNWMNPATSNKLGDGEVRKSKIKERILQGEKGIGRFSSLKLGNNIKITTRPRDLDEEYVINFDFSKYDDDFIQENGIKKDLFLDDINISFLTRQPAEIIEKPIELGYQSRIRENHGTIIEISGLKVVWNEQKLKGVCEDVSKLQPLFSSRRIQEIQDSDNETSNNENVVLQKNEEFKVYFYLNGVLVRHSDEDTKKVYALLENSAVFRITDGEYDSDTHKYIFNVNDELQSISFDDPLIRGIGLCKNRFGSGTSPTKRYPKSGPFKFSFYIFDFSNDALPKYRLDREQKNSIKNHRIYLYRDGIRVYPYGDYDNDWLKIDIIRGTVKASEFPSNDQTIGLIEISKEMNPLLKDKTNREGLIEEGEATEDFIVAIQIILSYIRNHPYRQYREKIKSQKAQDIFKKEQINQQFNALKEHLKNSNDNEGLSLVSLAEQAYSAEKHFLVQRAEITEDLAGVGLSVETASHDVMSFMAKTLQAIDDLGSYCLNSSNLDRNFLFGEISKVKGMLTFVDSQLKDIQLLFRSSKRRRRIIRIKDMLDKVVNIYKKSLKDNNIEFSVVEKGSPLIAKTTEAVILQLLINLFDNAIYWEDTVERAKKEILITLDGQNGTLIFSDNGPGIRDDDEPYIFEPFYSGKGQEGRGLGLYIARQLLERNDYSIDLADLNADKILSGANFVVNFIPEGERDDS